MFAYPELPALANLQASRNFHEPTIELGVNTFSSIFFFFELTIATVPISHEPTFIVG